MLGLRLTVKVRLVKQTGLLPMALRACKYVTTHVCWLLERPNLCVAEYLFIRKAGALFGELHVTFTPRLKQRICGSIPITEGAAPTFPNLSFGPAQVTCLTLNWHGRSIVLPGGRLHLHNSAHLYFQIGHVDSHRRRASVLLPPQTGS
jgi:hypothetical protein